MISGGVLSGKGVLLSSLRRVLLGRMMASEEAGESRVSNPIGLAIFSSDALSSVAYATQEIMASLSGSLAHLGIAVAAVAAHPLYRLSIPVGVGIVLLIVVIGASYRQTIAAYPKGAGAYAVAKENLGETASLVAGASLLIDYILTVAVAVSSGVANIASALTFLKGHEVGLSVVAIALIATANLRGVKDSGRLFAVPTYGFALAMAVMLGIGMVRVLMGHGPSQGMVDASVRSVGHVSCLAVIAVFLRAFSAGCTALTGVETIAGGVATFREPSAHNASRVMVWMMAMLAVFFLGMTLLSNYFNISYAHSPDPGVIPETLLSGLARAVYGDVSAGLPKLAYLSTMAFTFLILVVAANSAFAGFPRLSAIMSRHGYLPKQLDNLGDRLVFSNGIISLATVSCVLVVLFNANTDLLLPLYALGVFTGFTLSQAGMLVHWWRRRGVDGEWRKKATVSGVGAAATAVVWLDIAANKFKTEHGHGVWMILLAMPAIVYVLLRIHRHYIRINTLLAISRGEAAEERKNHVIVLVSRIHHGTLEAVRYAKAIADDGQVVALCVDFLDESGLPGARRLALEGNWHKYCGDVPLRFIETRYRQTVTPIIEELGRMRESDPDSLFTVVLPEFLTDSFLGNFLHNQTALRIKTMLMPLQNTVVVSVPYKIEGHRR